MCCCSEGATVTTIGLKKRRKDCAFAFCLQNGSKQQKTMLKWIITDKDIVFKAIYNYYLINYSDICNKLHQIQGSISEENIKLSLIEPFFPTKYGSHCNK